MLRHEGADRSARHDLRLAGYLASVAGFVNSAGFVLIGSFTSHVTGNVGRLADDLATGDAAAGFAALMVGAFFAGAFLASLAIESRGARLRTRIYGVLLLVEAAALGTFAALAYVADTRSARIHDALAMLLCLSMGLQNSLVTRLSGAVVRTTHLTGVVTDLGIESARWVRRWRGRSRVDDDGHGAAVAPHGPKTRLLLTIFVAFVAGSALGAVLASRLGYAAVVLPVAALAGGGLFALVARDPGGPVADDNRR